MLPEINHINLRIHMIHYKRLINNAAFNRGEISIGEYNIDNITDKINTEWSYYPKRIFSLLLPFMVKIIEESVVIRSIYCFGINQHNSYENPHDIQVMNKDIEVELEFETPATTIEILIKDCINNMEDNSFSLMDELDYGVTLTVVRIEILDDEPRSILNGNNTYKEDNCLICIDKNPNMLFCSCGHICICEECFDRLDNKTICLKCREKNTIIRKI